MFRSLFLAIAFLVALPAYAGQIAIVDFQRAVTETDEGKQAQQRIDTMYETRKAEIDKMRVELESEIQDYQARAMILSEQARAEAEASLAGKQQRFEETYMRYQAELQQTYGTLLQDLDEKMRALATTIANEKNYDLVLDSAVVVHSGGDVVDMTSELVTRYNSSYK